MNKYFTKPWLGNTTSTWKFKQLYFSLCKERGRKNVSDAMDLEEKQPPFRLIQAKGLPLSNEGFCPLSSCAKKLCNDFANVFFVDHIL